MPNRRNIIEDDSFDFYNVERLFTIQKLPVINIGSGSSLTFLLVTLSFYISLVFFLLTKRNVVLYTRGETALALAWLLPRKIFFWETHIKPDKMSRYIPVLKRAKGIITVTKYYARELEQDFDVLAKKLLTAPDAVDEAEFDLEADKLVSRRRVGLPEVGKIILYTGHLYGWKGVDTLAKSADYLNEDTLVVIVGGTAEDLKTFRATYGNKSNLLIVGHKPHDEIKYYLRAADVLVVPNSAKSIISQYYTSPLKLFEYMASGVPIVASDLVSFREILNEDNACFFQPDDEKDLAGSILSLLDDPDVGYKLGSQARRDVEEYTWTRRGQRILAFINDRLEDK
ncbi:MAG: glycosyltransferase family 4 protein [Thermodesulfobacteriota bacterium]